MEGTRVAEQLLTIGRFARLVGLSVGALRHYDEVGVLVPAEVDASSGYRRYRWSQVDDARTVALLRELEVPLDDVREVLAEDDPAARRQLLARHRDRVAARVVRLQRVLHRLAHLVDPDGHDHHHEEDGMTVTTDLDTASQTALAKSLFNRTWELLETADRTSAQDEELLHCAHASRYHWGAVGTERELAIGDWQVSRVYAVLGRGEPAVHHARKAHDHARTLGDVEGDEWLLASAYEGLSRAYAVAGDKAAAREWRDKAVARLELVTDADDREVVEGDLATLPLG